MTARDFSPLLAEALGLRALGLSVIPVHAPGMPLPPGQDDKSAGKTPLIAWKEYQTRLPSEEEIRAWWAQWPEANVGVITGAISGVIVVDVDGPEGQQTFRQLNPVPVTWRSTTGRGEHVWFKHPGFEVKNFAKKAPGLDFRGDRGYVVAPGSRHRNGSEYRWAIPPHQAELAEAPPWLLDLIGQPAERGDGAGDSEARWWLQMLQGAQKGERHDVAVRIAGHYLGIGREPEEVEAMLLSFAARCLPPHDAQDIRRIVKDLAEKERQKRAAGDNGGGFRAEGGPGGEGDQEPARKRDDKTDWGNAQRLVRRFGDILRWCEEWNCWLVWNGFWWKRDRTLEIERKVKDTVLGVYREASGAPTTKERRALAQHAMRSESSGKLRAVAEVAKSEPGIPILPEHLDRDPWKAGCRNGTLDLRTGQLITPRKEDMITRTMAVAFDPAATCPLWEQFLNMIVPDPEVRAFLQRAVGYSLTGDSSERVLFVLYGTGSNGKSTFLNVLRCMIGDYAAALRIQSLLAQKQDQIPADLADARGARFVTVSEYRAGQRLAEEFVKLLTGRDPVRARRLHENFFTFVPEFKLFLAVNYKPNIKEAAPAIWDRIRLVPFEVRIEEAERDKHLDEKLKAELPGIMNWALRGSLDWQQRGLGEPAKILEATRAYRKEQDLIGQFLDECCEMEAGHSVTVTQLYAAYVAWCQQNNENPVSKKVFGSEMARRGYPSAPVGHKRRYKGVTLTSEAEQELFRGPSEPSREREPGGDDVPF